MSTHPARKHRTWRLLPTALLLLSLVLGATLVVGQGGTGRENTNTAKPAVKRTTPKPTRSTVPAKPSSSRPALPRTRTNQAGIEFALIPPGSFMMGSTNGEADERPVHEVTINYSLYMGKYEVTQAQWQAVIGSNPSHFKECGGNCPVEQVSWDDVQNFINKLNEKNDAFIYRLPSEAEWEYACRAGTTGDYAGNLSETAWISENAGDKTHAVGQKHPNAWGLADMHGNVWEWCQDWYHDTYYFAPNDGSAWLSGGEQKSRVVRGGSWGYHVTSTRSASRYFDTSYHGSDNFGFRVVALAR